MDFSLSILLCDMRDVMVGNEFGWRFILNTWLARDSFIPPFNRATPKQQSTVGYYYQ